MPIEIAKLLVKIGADTKELENGLAKSNKSVSGFTQGLKSGLHGISTGFAVAGAAATAFVTTWKVMSEVAKQGAAIEYTAGKFDRLSKAVGTTSDALMVDLRQATKNTMSDAQIMQSAGDLMSLGLAKTHDQVVRLSTVSAGLGMDMNQLVLTLANQTTMRFDQLGVSVDGFEAKVEALKATGMSASDAFNEAFLQQAEEQLKKVGNAADEAVGSMQRFDAAIADIGDALKRKWAPFFAKAAEGGATLLNWGDNLQDMLKLHSREMIKTAGSYEVYAAEMTRAAEAAGYFVSENGDLMQKVFIPFKGVKEVVVQTNYLNEALYLGARAALVFGNGMKDIDLDALTATDASGFDTLVSGAQDAQTELQGMLTTVGNLQGAIANFNSGLASEGQNALGQWLYEGGAKYEEGLGALDKALGTNLLKTKEQSDAVKQLAQDFATGKINAEQYGEGMKSLSDAGTAEMRADLETSTEQAGILAKILKGLPEEVNLAINFDVEALPDWLVNLMTNTNSGRGGGSGTTQTRALGGAAWAGQPYLVGERGPEFFVPQQSGQIVRNSDSAKMGGHGVTLNNWGTIVTSDGDPFGAQLLAGLV